jgi:hypothetical protein
MSRPKRLHFVDSRARERGQRQQPPPPTSPVASRVTPTHIEQVAPHRPQHPYHPPCPWRDNGLYQCGPSGERWEPGAGGRRGTSPCLSPSAAPRSPSRSRSARSRPWWAQEPQPWPGCTGADPGATQTSRGPSDRSLGGPGVKRRGNLKPAPLRHSPAAYAWRFNSSAGAPAPAPPPQPR